MRASAINRFWQKVRILPNGCWEWIGSRHEQGYGLFWVDGKHIRAHRFAYEYYNNTKIPEGLVTDHLCKNTWCVNPNHIEAVTPKVNTERSDVGRYMIERQAQRTHCANGHPFTIESTYIYPNGKHIHCRICQREAKQRFLVRRGNEHN